jgi:hypothetical protein
LLLNLPITFRHEFLVISPSRQGLTESKQMLPAIVSNQRFDDGLFRGFDPSIPKCGQFCWIPLARQNGIHDAEARESSDVADDVMDLQIHLIQSFLHPQYVAGRCLN